MNTAVVAIVWILLALIAGLSMLLLYAVFGVSRGIQKLLTEQKVTNSLLRELGQLSSRNDPRLWRDT